MLNLNLSLYVKVYYINEKVTIFAILCISYIVGFRAFIGNTSSTYSIK